MLPLISPYFITHSIIPLSLENILGGHGSVLVRWPKFSFLKDMDYDQSSPEYFL
jgi:hypothetical protein